MSKIELIALVVTSISLLSFCIVFTILFSHYCKGSSEEIISGKKDIELLDNELMQKKSQKREHKSTKIIKKVLSYIVLAFLGIFLSLSVYSKITNDLMPIGNTALLTVASGSMSSKNEANPYLKNNNLNNQFQTYDIIVIHHVNEEDLKLYDVIAYRNEKNVIIIHRIIKIENTSEGTKYYTRGDANNKTDDFVSTYKNVVGRYTNQRVPILGLFVLFLQSYSGMVTIIAVIYCLWMFDSNYSKLKQTCYKRVDILLSVIKDPVDLKDFKTSYLQYIYYQSNIYEFVNGSFTKKISKDNVNKTDDDTFYIVSKANENVDLSAKNIESGKVKILSTAEKEKAINEIQRKVNEKE